MDLGRTVGSARLGPQERARALARLSGDEFDVIVVGGGVTGAGAALDAATRGLKVALLEARDLASGTSSRSGKVFHGGLRYLEQLNVLLVKQASRERNLMVEHLCPHLTNPAPFLFPLSKHVERPYIGAGLVLYDILGGARRTMPWHRHLSRSRALREMPALRADRVSGALQYYDVVFDDARHTMTVARTAAAFGAQVVTDLEVVEVTREGQRVTGVRARDHESDADVQVRGRTVVSATGVWAEDLQQLAGESRVSVRPAKGVHLVIPRDRISSRTGLTARTADSALFIRPWGDRYWIAGTTDTPYEFDRRDPSATSADVEYLLAEINQWVTPVLTRDDIVGVYAGLRPLLFGKGESTAALSRDHAVLEGPEGMVTIVGGKYTTYRLMAKDAVDAVVRRLGDEVAPSCTEQTPLVGAHGWKALQNQARRLADESGLPVEQVHRLLRRYGSLVAEVLELAERHPELTRPIEGAAAYLEVEAVYAASHECALHLDDVLARRTHINIETDDRGLAAAPRVAELIGDVLGWDGERRRREVARYEAQVEFDRKSEAVPDERSAADLRSAILSEDGRS